MEPVAQRQSLETEQRRHEETMESLTRQFQVPLASIATAYDEELKRLNGTARIRDYVPILIAKCIRDRIRKSQGIFGR